MFRGAVRGDLPQILKIYAHARAVMKASGNPTQWGDDFPPQELLEEDIDSNRLFLYVVNGQIEAVFAFILGADPTYAAIEDGQWLDDTLPYGTVHRLASAGKHKGVGNGRAGLEHGALPEPACRHPRRQQDHAASAGKERLYPLRRHPCGRRLAPLCLPEACPHPAAGLKQNTPPKSPGLRMQSLPCRTAHAGFFVCPRSLRPAPLDGDGENKAANGQTCPCYKYRSTEKPHGHRPECKFVNEKCLKTLSFLCRMCYNNTRPCVRDRKLCAIGVQ